MWRQERRQEAETHALREVPISLPNKILESAFAHYHDNVNDLRQSFIAVV
jgi:hypothetical protein